MLTLLLLAGEIAFPVEGLTGTCCEEPVRVALAKIDGVESVTVKKDGSQYVAVIGLKEGRTLKLSTLRAALGTPFKPGPISVEHLYALKEAKDLAGTKSISVEGEWTFPVFEAETLPTLDKLKFSEAILAPHKDGYRWGCRKHPERVCLAASKCPDCGGDMERMDASRVRKPVPKKKVG